MGSWGQWAEDVAAYKKTVERYKIVSEEQGKRLSLATEVLQGGWSTWYLGPFMVAFQTRNNKKLKDQLQNSMGILENELSEAVKPAKPNLPNVLLEQIENAKMGNAKPNKTS